MRLVLAGSISVIILLSACAQSSSRDQDAVYIQAQPEWVRGDMQRYPDHSFITGHGVSADLMNAKQMARDEVLEKFSAQINLVIREKSTQDQSNLHIVSNTDPHQLVKIDAYKAQLDQHVQIAEQWIDPISNAHHVLVVLDRIKFGEEFSGEIFRLDQQIERYLEKAESEIDPLQKVAITRLAISKQIQRQHLHTILKIVKPTSAVLPVQWGNTKVDKQLEQAIAQTNIMPIAGGENMQYLPAIRDGIQAAGFTVDIKQKPHYILKARFEQTQMRWQDGLYLLNGHLHMKLLDGQLASQVRGEIEWPIEVSAPDRENLQQELAHAIKEINQEKFRRSFLDIEIN